MYQQIKSNKVNFVYSSILLWKSSCINKIDFLFFKTTSTQRFCCLLFLSCFKQTKKFNMKFNAYILYIYISIWNGWFSVQDYTRAYIILFLKVLTLMFQIIKSSFSSFDFTRRALLPALQVLMLNKNTMLKFVNCR